MHAHDSGIWSYAIRMANKLFALAALFLPITFTAAQNIAPSPRLRSSDIGLKVGILPSGPLDAITDVSGVAVGHTTIIRADNIRTGVTAVLPHSGNLFREKVPAAIFVGNGFGKLAGSTQVDEMGNIETPILLTSTTSVPRVADALITYMLALPGNEDVLSINPIVGETNDGYLSDIRGRHITPDDVFAAIKNAKGGPVEEGNVGAGTGTVVFGWKGGIGTASRRLPANFANVGGYTVGVLVQTNFGGVLTIAGAPVGQELGQYYLRQELQQVGNGAVRKQGSKLSGRPGVDAESVADDGAASVPGNNAASVLGNVAATVPVNDVAEVKDKADGSCMIIIATDAPLDARNMKRLAARAWLGIARTGSSASNGSGDYAIAFSTAPQGRIHSPETATKDKVTDQKALLQNLDALTNDAMSPLFEAVLEATEEAVYNSMFKAATMTSNGHTVEALPIEKTVEILKQHRVIK